MSRARLNKNNRRKGALERRLANVADYEGKVKTNEGTAKEFYADKLAKAKDEVKSLQGKVTQ